MSADQAADSNPPESPQRQIDAEPPGPVTPSGGDRSPAAPERRAQPRGPREAADPARESGEPDRGGASRQDHAPPRWLRTSVIVVGAVLLVVLLALFAAAFLPGWWAGLVARQVDGIGAAGILWGLTYGGLFTVIPLLIGWVAVRSSWHWRTRLIIGAIALLTMLPNLLTLAITLGPTEPTRQAGTVLRIAAPNFRMCTLIGVIVTLLVAGAVIFGVRTVMASRKALSTPPTDGTDPGADGPGDGGARDGGLRDGASGGGEHGGTPASS